MHRRLLSRITTTASWTFADLEPGTYRLSVTWTPGADRAPDAAYAVQTSSGVTSVPVNQRLAPDDARALDTDWESLGTFTMAGGSLTVRLASRASGRVIADAVRLERVGAAAAAVAPVSNAIARATLARAALAAARATQDVIDEPALVL